MDSLLLTRDELDKKENNPIFTLWLFGNVDESKLTSEEKEIIVARQLYIDLIISDHSVSFILDRLNCYGLDSLLNNEDKLKTASIMFNVRSDVLRTKLFLMKKRQEKEKQMKLSKKESL